MACVLLHLAAGVIVCQVAAEHGATSYPIPRASEVFRAGLWALGAQERLYEAKLERLRSAIDEGDATEDDDYTLDGPNTKSRLVNEKPTHHQR